MKKGLSGIIAVLILLLCLSGAAAAEESSESSEESPGWKITDSSEITEAAQAAFDLAAAELTDAVYEPVALLGEQQGVFCILCRATGDYEGAEPYYTLVYAGENGVQNIWDLWIESHSMPERESGEEEQTVDIPDVETTATADDTGMHVTLADSDITITDVVKYRNLVPGKEYTMHGKLMLVSEDGEKAEEILAAARKEAQSILDAAQKEAKDFKTKVEGDVKMAAAQSLQATKKDIEDLMLHKMEESERSLIRSSKPIVLSASEACVRIPKEGWSPCPAPPTKTS